MRREHPVRKINFNRFKSSRLLQFFIAAACLIFLAGMARAQEALQMSLAGESAEEANKQAANTVGYYNLLMGPVAWRFSAGAEADYNDNVNLKPNDPDGDFIFRPSVNADMTWPLTQNNTL